MLADLGLRRLYATVALLSVLLAGCTEDPGRSTVHPVEEYVPHSSSVDQTVSTTDSATTPLNLRRLSGTGSWSVGRQEKGDSTIFGKIADVAYDNGQFVVLDYDRRKLSVFSEDGSHVTSVGGKGLAPGNFQYPNQLALLGDDHLLAAERTGRIQIFEWKENDYRHESQLKVPFTPSDVCTLGGEMYVHGFWVRHDEHSIHVFDRAGEHQRSIGPVYAAEHPSVRRGLSDGSLVCNAEENVLSFAPVYSALVYGLAPNGDRQWVTRIAPFDPAPVKRIRKQGRVGLLFSSEPNTDKLSDLVHLPGPGFLVLRTRTTGTGDPPRETVHAYRLSARTGEGTYAGPMSASIRAVGASMMLTQPLHFPALVAHPISK